jgi:exopolysaccharide biosynthesis polyprenyl glycosylphosphotransferase
VPAYEIIDFARLSLVRWIGAMRALDLLGAALLAVAVQGLTAASWQHDLPQLGATIGGAVAVWLLAAKCQGLYDSAKVVSGRGMLTMAVSCCAITLCIVLLLSLGAGPLHGGTGTSGAAIAGAALAWVVGARLAWQAGLRAALARGYCLERALVLAETAAAARFVGSALERRHHGRIRVAATAPFPGMPDSPGVAWVEEAVRKGIVDRVVIADGEETRDTYSAILPRLMHLAVDITLLPRGEVMQVPPVRINVTGAVPPSDVAHWPLSQGQAIAKRALDIVVASLALVALAPLLLLIAVVIKLDSAGPVFFVQKRNGLRGSVFDMWKFRTMYHDLADRDATRQTSRHDHRITRIGRVLRRTSLDELPQLLNVLRGEMSIVGPRPHALGMTVAGRQLHDVVEGYTQRYAMKPGITGWAQVNGCRGEINCGRKLRRRVALDCHYIENWSIFADAWIILRTAALFAFDRHAY